MFCPHCLACNSPVAVTCHNCGRALERVDERESVAGGRRSVARILALAVLPALLLLAWPLGSWMGEQAMRGAANTPLPEQVFPPGQTWTGPGQPGLGSSGGFVVPPPMPLPTPYFARPPVTIVSPTLPAPVPTVRRPTSFRPGKADLRSVASRYESWKKAHALREDALMKYYARDVVIRQFGQQQSYDNLLRLARQVRQSHTFNDVRDLESPEITAVEDRVEIKAKHRYGHSSGSVTPPYAGDRKLIWEKRDGRWLIVEDDFPTNYTPVK